LIARHQRIFRTPTLCRLDESTPANYFMLSFTAAVLLAFFQQVAISLAVFDSC
jgi:hypothetical protein